MVTEDKPRPSPKLESPQRRRGSGRSLYADKRHLRSENRSERTIATYLVGLRQADAFLCARGTTIEAATRADLESFMGRLRRPSSAAVGE